MRSADYVSVVGIVDVEGRVDLQPLFPAVGMSRVSYEEKGHGAENAVVELMGERDVIARRSFPMAPICAYPTRHSLDKGARLFAGTIEYDANCAGIRILIAGRVAKDVRATHEVPRVSLDWIPRGSAKGIQKIPWRVEPESAAVMLLYSGDGARTWQPLTIAQGNGQIEVNFDQLPGSGECLLRAVASGGLRWSTTETYRFQLAPQQPYAVIASPAAGTVMHSGHESLFCGFTIGLKELPKADAFTWFSSETGMLGWGPAIRVSMLPGKHRVTLFVSSGEQVRPAAVVVEVVD